MARLKKEKLRRTTTETQQIDLQSLPRLDRRSEASAYLHDPQASDRTCIHKYRHCHLAQDRAVWRTRLSGGKREEAVAACAGGCSVETITFRTTSLYLNDNLGNLPTFTYPQSLSKGFENTSSLWRTHRSCSWPSAPSSPTSFTPESLSTWHNSA